MKKILLIVLLLAGGDGFSQEKDWFISLSTSYVINGPGYQLKDKMRRQFFNSYEVGFLWDQDNPSRGWRFNLMARGGRRLTSKFMVHGLAGLADQGWVRGYSESATFTAGAETHPNVDYKLFGFAAGMLYSPGKVKAGIAPALFLLAYQFHGENKKKSTAPGVNFSLQLPVSNQDKNIGCDLVFDANYAAPIKMSRDSGGNHLFQPGKINMMTGSVGLAFTLR